MGPLLPATARFHRQPNLVSAALADGVAVLDLPAASVLALNPTATAVWNLLDTPRSLEEIVEPLLARFAVSPARCREEVERLLSRLLADGLIAADDGTPGV